MQATCLVNSTQATSMPQTLLHHSIRESTLIPMGLKHMILKTSFGLINPSSGAHCSRLAHSLPCSDSTRASPPARPCRRPGAAFHAENPFPPIFNFHFRFLVPFSRSPAYPAALLGRLRRLHPPLPRHGRSVRGPDRPPGAAKQPFPPRLALPSRRPTPDPPSHRPSPAVATAAPRSGPPSGTPSPLTPHGEPMAAAAPLS